MIEDSADWTLENGYRNIVATMGISLDGMYRNKIGQMAEDIIKMRIIKWLKNRPLIINEGDGVYTLRDETVMRYGSEPDITFERGGKIIATIEIKGGTDPAGSLERLGAMQKSFAETPPGCINFLIAGVVTQEMQNRLDQIGMVKYFLLSDLTENDRSWENFMKEVFHHTVRIVS
ncbi:MAG: XcyI family restriction endonuclease [Nitrospira sp. SB0675_bin_23]|nr:XcyI family restriction endonuclease [Nitrospira sp. SB0675_bin_23]